MEFVRKALRNLAKSLAGKPKKRQYRRRRPVTQEDLLHLKRTGRYVPVSQTTWKNNIFSFFAKLAAPIWLPIMFLEKRIIEPLANLAESADLFKILEKFGVLIAVFVFLLDIGVRRENSIYQAWQVVKDGQGEKSGVVVLALERLKKNGFNLSGINVEDTSLIRINLSNAVLMSANFAGANLLEADLTNATLLGANLTKAILLEANLTDAILVNANLTGANLKGANLTEAFFRGANLKGATLLGANLKGAYLRTAKNLTPEEVKRAKNWEQAIYSPDFRKRLGLPPVPPEPQETIK
ncbi:MAG: pentapeptide repeat-containing protein [Cyanobacteriota bacterium]